MKKLIALSLLVMPIAIRTENIDAEIHHIKERCANEITSQKWSSPEEQVQQFKNCLISKINKLNEYKQKVEEDTQDSEFIEALQKIKLVS
jgi:hypothetical protein